MQTARLNSTKRLTTETRPECNVRWPVEPSKGQPNPQKRRPVPEENHRFAESSEGFRAMPEATVNNHIRRNHSHLSQLAAASRRAIQPLLKGLRLQLRRRTVCLAQRRDSVSSRNW